MSEQQTEAQVIANSILEIDEKITNLRELFIASLKEMEKLEQRIVVLESTRIR